MEEFLDADKSYTSSESSTLTFVMVSVVETVIKNKLILLITGVVLGIPLAVVALIFWLTVFAIIINVISSL